MFCYYTCCHCRALEPGPPVGIDLTDSRHWRQWSTTEEPMAKHAAPSTYSLKKALKQHRQKGWIGNTDWHSSPLTLWHGNEVFKSSPPVSALFFISFWLGDALHRVCLPTRLNKTHRTQVKLIKAHLYARHRFWADWGTWHFFYFLF